MLTNDLYHVNQHKIPYIMQKKNFLKTLNFRGKKFFSDPIPHLGRITFDTNMRIFFKIHFSCSTHQELLEYMLSSFFQKS